MLSEILFIWLISRLITQGSALWMSLILVPISLLVLLSFSNLNNFSGVMGFIMVLVFIGGLLVLLVSISSTSALDQSISSGTSMIWSALVFFYSFLSFETKLLDFSTFPVALFSWLNWSPMILTMIVSILSLSLCLMTWLSLSFKGSLRGV